LGGPAALAKKYVVLEKFVMRSMYNDNYHKSFFFLSGEGPRSRRYGRTAALRLLVQPYDEDDDDDYYFLSFS
jgi:hypothetical protein